MVYGSDYHTTERKIPFGKPLVTLSHGNPAHRIVPRVVLTNITCISSEKMFLFHTRSTILDFYSHYSYVWIWVLVPGKISLDTLHRRLKASSYLFLFFLSFSFISFIIRSWAQHVTCLLWRLSWTYFLNTVLYIDAKRIDETYKFRNIWRITFDTVTIRPCRELRCILLAWWSIPAWSSN